MGKDLKCRTAICNREFESHNRPASVSSPVEKKESRREARTESQPTWNIYVRYMSEYIKYIFSKSCIFKIISHIYLPKYIWHIFKWRQNIFSWPKVVYVAYIFNFHGGDRVSPTRFLHMHAKPSFAHPRLRFSFCISTLSVRKPLILASCVKIYYFWFDT